MYWIVNSILPDEMKPEVVHNEKQEPSASHKQKPGTENQWKLNNNKDG